MLDSQSEYEFRKKPSFQEKTRFQYALIDIKYFENEPLNKGGGRNLL